MMDDHFAGSNADAPILPVEHAYLVRFSGLVSFCPVCKVGTLGMWRDPKTLMLHERDNCLLCGQRYRYIDIDSIREKDWA